MNVSFDPALGLVIVTAKLWGPTGNTYAQLAVDTGATSTLIRTAVLVSIGCDPALTAERVQVTTASGVEYVPRVKLKQFFAIGRSRRAFSVLCHTLPPSAGIDGLLGLDFFRGRRLTVDFRARRVRLD